MSIIAGTAIESALGGYQIDRSLRFNSADSAYLNRTPASAGNQQTWTWSGWVKRSALTNYYRLFTCNRPSAGNEYRLDFGFNNTDTLKADFVYNAASVSLTLETNAVYRDVSGWYHIILVADTTNATSSDRIRLYVNGSRVTSFSTAQYPNQNQNFEINATVPHGLGYSVAYGAYFSGYMTEVNFIDGQALDPTSFGEYNVDTGVWQPIAYSGSYGTNGFYLNFSDNSGTTSTTLGKDYSGNGNNWTPNNFSVTAGVGNDSMVDVPTLWGTDTGAGGEVRGNYCTLNPLDVPYESANRLTFANGNLDWSGTNQGVASRGTLSASTGKYYFEMTAGTIGNGISVGVCQSNFALYNWTGTFTWYDASGGINVNGTRTSGYSTYTTNDIIGIAVNLDSSSVTFYKNGTLVGSGALSSGAYFPVATQGSTATSGSGVMNFGQRPFAYTAPSGFAALCTQNLPDPTIADGSTAFNAVLWTGDGTSSRAFTGWGFAPDFIWMKNRSGTADHALIDIVRGTGAKVLSSNQTYADNDYGLSVTSFDSDGFTGATGSINFSYANTNSGTYVGWGWKAGGSSVSNTDGSITSTVSANPTAGFSVVTYTGTGSAATVGHGLGVAPAMMLFKSRNTTQDWGVYHQYMNATPQNYRMFLNLTDAAGLSTLNWNSTAPTSTVFSLGAGGVANVSTTTYVSYCFAPVEGYSAFGKYTGNGSSDGPFVYTGFRPRFWMTKRTDTTSSWLIVDSERNTYNVVDKYLVPNTSNTEGTATVVDFTSNGVKFRGTTHNDSGGTFIYAAFAENPFKYSLAR